MEETFIAMEDNKGHCIVEGCNAKKVFVTTKSGKRYWKYDVLIMEQGNHKHKWARGV